MTRYDFPTPENVNDHELNCGGFGRQQKNNGGKGEGGRAGVKDGKEGRLRREGGWCGPPGLCGVCGDPYDQPRPRDNELGGRWGRSRASIVEELFLL